MTGVQTCALPISYIHTFHSRKDLCQAYVILFASLFHIFHFRKYLCKAYITLFASLFHLFARHISYHFWLWSILSDGKFMQNWPAITWLSDIHKSIIYKAFCDIWKTIKIQGKWCILLKFNNPHMHVFAFCVKFPMY